MNDFKTPKDNELMTEKYKIEKGGICGQSCLAVIEKSSIQEVMDNWNKLDMEFKGWSGWRQLSSYLKNRGFSVKQKNKLDSFSPNASYIARVQWIGEGEKKEKPFYGWGHWSQASAYTHFIVIVKDQQFFCNETGWDSISNLQSYLRENNGLITSYLEVIAPNQNSATQVSKADEHNMRYQETSDEVSQIADATSDNANIKSNFRRGLLVGSN